MPEWRTAWHPVIPEPVPMPNYAKRQPVKATGGIQLSSDPQNFEEVNTLSVENEDVQYSQCTNSLYKV